jgi:hypothetical protein
MYKRVLKALKQQPKISLKFNAVDLILIWILPRKLLRNAFQDYSALIFLPPGVNFESRHFLQNISALKFCCDEINLDSDVFWLAFWT